MKAVFFSLALATVSAKQSYSSCTKNADCDDGFYCYPTDGATSTCQSKDVKGDGKKFAVCHENGDCQLGLFCTPSNDYTFSWCQPNVRCSYRWTQCGGTDFYGPSCCSNNMVCKKWTSSYWQCVPGYLAREAEKSCINVSVEGDATYCTKGPICGDEGKNCPKKGDVAVADCTKTLKSYIDANSKCVAPADALCQKLQNGSWGCGLDRVNSTTGSPATTSSPATSAAANDKQCSTNWSQCNGQNWPFGVCCQDPKFQCNKKNDYLSLCEPKDKKRVAEDAAVGPWQQCGGNGYVGDTTCTTGNKCVEIDEYYHQCQPETNESGQPTWSQCGGKDYTGERSCLDEDVCTKFDDNYS
ncbi:unnamed protein product, partial [Aphanomyces euteiches]